MQWANVSLSQFSSSTHISEEYKTLLSSILYLKEMDITCTVPYKSMIYIFYKRKKDLARTLLPFCGGGEAHGLGTEY